MAVCWNEEVHHEFLNKRLNIGNLIAVIVWTQLWLLFEADPLQSQCILETETISNTNYEQSTYDFMMLLEIGAYENLIITTIIINIIMFIFVPSIRN